MKKLNVGDGLDPSTEMGPCINEQQLQTVMKYVEIGMDEGAKMVCGGHRLDKGAWRRLVPRADRFVDCEPEMRIARRRFSGRWLR